MKVTWVVQMCKWGYTNWDGRGTDWGSMDRGRLMSTFDVLQAQEKIADKFLVLRNEVLSGHGNVGFVSREHSKLCRGSSGRVEVVA